MTHRNRTKWSQLRTSTLRWFVLTTIAALEGCVGLPPPSNREMSGVNLEYLFGARRPQEQANISLTEDPEYAEYLEWKRWQDFQAYQEWKRLRNEEVVSGDSGSN